MAATWSDATDTYRVDVKIRGTEIATVNYATNAYAVAAIACAAQALTPTGDDDFPVTVEEIVISRNGGRGECTHESGAGYEYETRDGKRYPAGNPEFAFDWSTVTVSWECDECGAVYANENYLLEKANVRIAILEAQLRGEEI